MRPCGFINLNKPSGISSRHATDVVARLARPAKAGHAGTLDPLASGVLVVGVGSATHLIEYVQRMRKQYLATFLLGLQSATEDIEGPVVELPNAPIPTREQLVEAAGRFVGRIHQQPPAFSALKVAGRRAYELARRGHQPQLAARPIMIYGIEVEEYHYPRLVLRVECGSGTYIRSLGRDLAKSLGTAAVMASLVRTAIGSFQIEDAVAPCDLRQADWRARLLPPLQAVEYLPCLRLSSEEVLHIQNGRQILAPPNKNQASATPDASSPLASIRELAAIGPDGQLVGILTDAPSGRLRVLRNLSTEDAMRSHRRDPPAPPSE